jgi:molybdopterin-containing oxidoreductase family iron-sulfur binding subunit
MGAGVLLPREVQAFGGMMEAIVAKMSEGIKGTIGKDIETPPPLPGVKFGMVIDLGLCIGCRRCSYGCKLENNVSDSINPPYIMVFQTKFKPGQVMAEPDLLEKNMEHGTLKYTKYKPGQVMAESDLLEKKMEHGTLKYARLRKDRMYMPVQCNHCLDAPCVKVCPTKATYKSADGIVMMDYNKCIGCRYCMAACPYGARRFNWSRKMYLLRTPYKKGHDHEMR